MSNVFLFLFYIGSNIYINFVYTIVCTFYITFIDFFNNLLYNLVTDKILGDVAPTNGVLELVNQFHRLLFLFKIF